MTVTTEPTPNPSNMLLHLIVALLAPMFLCVSGGDASLARYAALETVNAYRTRSQADLIAVAQIIAFGLVALGSLGLSLSDDLSLSMVLRLRGNANACNRSAEQNRRALAGSHATDAPIPQPIDPDTETFLSASAEQMLAAESQARLEPVPHPAQAKPATTQTVPDERARQQIWANAMLIQAQEITASLPSLPLAERQAALLQAETLNSVAGQLLTGPVVPPLEPGALAAMMSAQSGAPLAPL